MPCTCVYMYMCTYYVHVCVLLCAYACLSVCYWYVAHVSVCSMDTLILACLGVLIHGTFHGMCCLYMRWCFDINLIHGPNF